MSLRTVYSSLTSNKAIHAMQGIFTAMGKDVRQAEHAHEMTQALMKIEERGNLGFNEFRQQAMKSHPHKMDRINTHLDRLKEAIRDRQSFLNSDRINSHITG